MGAGLPRDVLAGDEHAATGHGADVDIDIRWLQGAADVHEVFAWAEERAQGRIYTVHVGTDGQTGTNSFSSQATTPHSTTLARLRNAKNRLACASVLLTRRVPWARRGKNMESRHSLRPLAVAFAGRAGPAKKLR